MRRSINNQPPVISLSDVTFQHPDCSGVASVSMHMRPGTLFGVVGAQGSGKTTLVRLITGVYRPQRGVVRVLDQDPLRFKARVREQVAQVLEPSSLKPELTVWEQLNLIASLYGLDNSQRTRRFQRAMTVMNLLEMRQRRIGELSEFAQRRLALACVLVQSPTVIVADEPCDQLTTTQRLRLWDCMRVLRDERRTLLVATAHVEDARRCDVVGILDRGRLLCVDTPLGLYRRALEGDLVRVYVARECISMVQRLLHEIQGVRAIHTPDARSEDLVVRVDHAVQRMPQILAGLRQVLGATRYAVEEYWPPFHTAVNTIIERAGRWPPEREALR
jgi:ABC-2 type transport system ATP-binding protein